MLVELDLVKVGGKGGCEGNRVQPPAVKLFFLKIDKSGFAKCSHCIKELNYGNGGSHALLVYCHTDVHRQKVSAIMTTASVVPPVQSVPKGPKAIRERARVPVPYSSGLLMQRYV